MVPVVSQLPSTRSVQGCAAPTFLCCRFSLTLILILSLPFLMRSISSYALYLLPQSLLLSP